MESDRKELAFKLYLFLAGIFITSLVVCNLIANKFVKIDFGFGFKPFILSVGILPYPITFLITDILSEIYGKKKTNQVVIVGFACSIFVLGVLWLGSMFNALQDSPVTNEQYNAVFKNSWRVIMASMIAYLIAQSMDVRLFHFWKNLTNGKHLWLRNNASTIFSQLLDTTLIVTILFIGVWSSGKIMQGIIDGWTFKIICALIDTPIVYAVTWFIRKKLSLEFGEEIELHR